MHFQEPDPQTAFDEAFDNRSPQQIVADATKERGYRDGFTPEQFLARQMLKMQEELGETVFHIQSHELWGLEDYFVELADYCRDSFDCAETWQWDDVKLKHSAGENLIHLKDELADMQVVLFNMAQVASEITGRKFDVVQAAVDKARKDVKRGVR